MPHGKGVDEMERTSRDVDEYLEQLRDDELTTLDRHLADIFAGTGRAIWEGTFWGGSEQSIVGYGDWTPDRAGTPWFMVGSARQRNHLSVYVNAVEDGEYVAKKYADALVSGTPPTPKVASIAFKTLANVDVDALLDLARIGRAQLDAESPR